MSGNAYDIDTNLASNRYLVYWTAPFNYRRSLYIVISKNVLCSYAAVHRHRSVECYSLADNVAIATLTEVFLNLTEVFLTLTEVFLTLTEVFLTLTEVFLTLTEVLLTLTDVFFNLAEVFLTLTEVFLTLRFFLI